MEHGPFVDDLLVGNCIILMAVLRQNYQRVVVIDMVLMWFNRDDHGIWEWIYPWRINHGSRGSSRTQSLKSTGGLPGNRQVMTTWAGKSPKWMEAKKEELHPFLWSIFQPAMFDDTGGSPIIKPSGSFYYYGLWGCLILGDPGDP